MSGAAIELRDVRKLYKVGPIFVETLKGIDLAIQEGEMALLTGDDLEGRAALMRVLGLIEPPTGGAMTIDGDDVTNLSAAARSSARNAVFGYVSEGLPLIDGMSVYDNVTLPLRMRDATRREIRDRALQSARYVGAEGLLRLRAGRLNPEETRRAQLARAIVGAPEALWVDDPWLLGPSPGAAALMDTFTSIRAETGVTLIFCGDLPAGKGGFDRLIRIEQGRVAP